MSEQDCTRLEELVRLRWDSLHRELFDQMTAALDAAPEPGTRRIRIDICAHHENELETDGTLLAKKIHNFKRNMTDMDMKKITFLVMGLVCGLLISCGGGAD